MPSARRFVERGDWPGTPFEVGDEERVRLTTEALRLEAATAPLRLSFADAAGSWLLREPADSGMAAEPGPDGGGRVRASFTFSGEQHFYGLGHGGGRLDRLGQTRQLWNSHLGHGPGSDIGLPLLVSSRGYGLFFDNTSDAVHAVGGPGGAARGDASTALRGHDARVPGAPRGVAAVRRGRGARISIGDRIRARRRRRRELPPGAASPRLLQPGGAGLVVVGAPRARLARRRRLVARRRRGTAGVGQAGRGRRPAAAQHLRSLPSPGIRRGRGGRAAGSPRVPALPLGRRRDAAVW